MHGQHDRGTPTAARDRGDAAAARRGDDPHRLAVAQSYVLAPLGWFLMLPFYFMKVLPVVGKRYVLTNRRVMIQRGWYRTVAPSEEVALADIDDVRLVRDSNSIFFNSGTLEIVSKGQVKLRLDGVKEPEVFRHAIRNACMAWVPEKAKEWIKWIPAKPPDGK
jgi:hypothetical protein